MTRRHRPGEPLTVAEVQTLELIAEGRTYKQIGERLCISAATVRNRVTNVIAKLGARNATHAAVLAVAYGWLRVGRPHEQRRPVPNWTRIARPQDCRAPHRITQRQG